MKISEILLKYNTDKNMGIKDPKKGHFYGTTYDEIFSWFNKNEKLTIMEIGVQKGGSLKAWRDYFKNAIIIGVDIVDVREKEYISSDLKFIKSDIQKIDIQNSFGNSLFDIIIDDGSHFLDDVLFVVENYAKRLKNYGVILIEDVQDAPKWFNKIIFKLMPENGCFNVQFRDMRNIGAYDDFIIIIKKVNDSTINQIYFSIANYLRLQFLYIKKYMNRLKVKFLGV